MGPLQEEQKMQRLIWTILTSFLMAIVFGPIVIPWLKRMKFG